jgi:hypothetical protein
LAAAWIAGLLAVSLAAALRRPAPAAVPDRYFVDMRRAGVALTSVSLAVTGLDAMGTLLVAGMAAAGRLDMLAAVVGSAFGLVVASLTVGRRLRLSRARSLPEAVRLAGAPALARLLAIALLVVEVGWVAMLAQFGWVLAGFLPGDPSVWSGVMVAWLALVVVLGGHRGVLRTDLLAGLMLLTGLGAAALVIWTAPRTMPAAPLWPSWWAGAKVGPQALALGGLFAARQLLAGAAAQRWLGLADPDAARRTGLWAALLTLLLGALALWLGVEATLAHLPAPVAPHVFLLELALRLPPLPQALLAAAVWAALAGAASSLVHAGVASVETEAIPQALRGSGRRRIAAWLLWAAAAAPLAYWTLLGTQEWFLVAEALIGGAVVPVGAILLGRTPQAAASWIFIGAVGLGLAAVQLATAEWPAALQSPFWPAALAGLAGTLTAGAVAAVTARRRA